MKIGVPKEVKNHEYRVAITPGRRARAGRPRPRGVRRDGGRRRLVDPRRAVRRGRRDDRSTPPTTSGATADMVLKVKEPVKEEYHRMREGQMLFTYLHLAADRPLTDELVERKVTGDRLRDRPAARRVAAAAGPDVARSPAGWRRRSGAHTLMRAAGRSRRADGRRLRGVRGQGRRDRRRRVRHERRRRSRSACRPRCCCSTQNIDRLRQVDRIYQGPHADWRPRTLRDRAGGDRRRPGDRCGARARREGAEAGDQRAGRRG